jgi:hypothetical protein
LECKKVLKVGKAISCVDWLIEEGAVPSLPFPRHRPAFRFTAANSSYMSNPDRFDFFITRGIRRRIPRRRPSASLFVLDVHAAPAACGTSERDQGGCVEFEEFG